VKSLTLLSAPLLACTAFAQDDSAHHGHNHGAMQQQASEESTAEAAPEDAVPSRAFEGPRYAADTVWGTDAMSASRRRLGVDHGAMQTGLVLIERLEPRFALGDAKDGYVWDVQARYGGDLNRVVFKSEGEGETEDGLEEAEVQALYSRAIGPFFDLQAGVRFDPTPESLSHLVIGVQGLAPYMFHVDGALFLSEEGNLTARIEGELDQRLTQRLIIQPRIEIELAARDIPELGLGSGITSIEPGVRLRYEFAREFAPYLGLAYESTVGRTADFARTANDERDGFRLMIGLRAWF